MPARRYRFHATDGRDAVFDMTGRLVGRQRELRSHAIAAARRVMDSCEAEFDWSAWNVDVYDPAGRCRMCVPFDDVGRKRDGRS